MVVVVFSYGELLRTVQTLSVGKVHRTASGSGSSSRGLKRPRFLVLSLQLWCASIVNYLVISFHVDGEKDNVGRPVVHFETEHAAHLLRTGYVYDAPVCFDSISVKYHICLERFLMLVAVPGEVCNNVFGCKNLTPEEVSVITHEQVRAVHNNSTVANVSFHKIMSAVNLLQGGFDPVIRSFSRCGRA